MSAMSASTDELRIGVTAAMLEEGLGGIDRTIDGSSFAFTTLDLSRRELTQLESDEPGLRGGAAVVEEEGDADESLATDPWGEAVSAKDRARFGFLASYRHVRFLDVSRNQLQSLRPLCGCPSLLAVSAASNLLASVPAELSRLPWLQVLDVSFNRIQRLDGRPSVGDPEGEVPRPAGVTGSAIRSGSLRELIIQSNGLESLAGLGVCPKLARVDASGNSLSGVIVDVGTSSSLVELLVGRNQLSGLAGLHACKRLRVLVAPTNRLASLRSLVDPLASVEAAVPKAVVVDPATTTSDDADDGGGAAPAPAVDEPSEEDRAVIEEETAEDFGLPDDRGARRFLVGASRSETLEAAVRRRSESLSAAGISSDPALTASGEAQSLTGYTCSVPTAESFVCGFGVVSADGDGASSSPLGSLSSLDLRGNESLESVQELFWLACLPALRSVDVRDCPVSDAGEGAVTELLIRVGPHLESINGSPITTAQRKAAAEVVRQRRQQRSEFRAEKAAERREAEERRRQAEADAAAAVSSDE